MVIEFVLRLYPSQGVIISKRYLEERVLVEGAGKG